ncbi:MFS transporter [Paraclostridium bifermentans]|uniref:MFS transporter n=1 Tax=Paraclostridium bifermentans TaxID=1490 RepID=UPI0024303DD5|nr:MFS transporter [Paraclostridium bifermentans]
MDQKELKRFNFNSWAFIVSYAFMGLMSGVAFDVLVTFLQQVNISTASSFSSFMGISNFVCAAILILAPKLGYKKLIITGPIMTIAALLAISFVDVSFIYPIATLAILVGVALFDIILPPYLTAYTTEKERTKVFSRAMYINVIGMVLATWFGGTITVSRLASRLKISNSQASAITENIKGMTSHQLHEFILAQRDVLLMFVVIAALSLIPLLFIKEKKEDYCEETTTKEKKSFDWSIFKNKYVVLWLVYFAMIRFGASLICPYFSVFLNNELGISRATTSQLVSYQYFAMVLFLLISPWAVKKLGNVIALGGLALLSIPFMLIIANGTVFGSGMVLAVGAALFFRSGFMNCANPIMNSLPMEFVSKNLRPAYNSLIFVAGGVTSIIAGQFTKLFLFKIPGGYSKAYYITGVIYMLASILLIVVYNKKYNRHGQDNKEDQAA